MILKYDLQDEYNSLVTEFYKLEKEVSTLRKENKKLTEKSEIAISPKSGTAISTKCVVAISPESDVAITPKEKHKVNIIQCSNCEILTKEKERLTTALEKFTKGSTMLKVILQEQKGNMDRAGIGYNPKPKPQRKTKFASFQENIYYPSSSYSFCNYCNKQGHTQSSC